MRLLKVKSSRLGLTSIVLSLLCFTLSLNAFANGEARVREPRGDVAKIRERELLRRLKKEAKVFDLSKDYREEVLRARAIGQTLSMKEIRSQLDVLTGEVALSKDLGIPFEGYKLKDRYSNLNRYLTRVYLAQELTKLGYTPSVEYHSDGREKMKIDYDLQDMRDSLKKGEKDAVKVFLKSDAVFSKVKLIEGEETLIPKYDEKRDRKALSAEVVNLYVEIPGTEDPNSVLEVTAHYDTAGWGVPGADDNGSGLTTALELARILKETKPKKTIRILFNDLEERGFVGSEMHVSLLRRNKTPISGAMVIDVIGYAPKDDHSAPFVIEEGFPEDHESLEAYNTSVFMSEMILDQTQRVLGRKVVPDVTTAAAMGDMADHGAYWRGGIPAVLIAAAYRSPYINPHHHQRSDNIKHVNFEYFEETARALTESIIRIVGAAPDQLNVDAGVVLHEQIPEMKLGTLEDSAKKVWDKKLLKELKEEAPVKGKKKESSAEGATKKGATQEPAAKAPVLFPSGKLVPKMTTLSSKRKVPVLAVAATDLHKMEAKRYDDFLRYTVEIIWKEAEKEFRIRWGKNDLIRLNPKKFDHNEFIPNFKREPGKVGYVFEMPKLKDGDPGSLLSTLYHTSGEGSLYRMLEALENDRKVEDGLSRIVELLHSKNIGIKIPKGKIASPKDIIDAIEADVVLKKNKFILKLDYGVAP